METGMKKLVIFDCDGVLINSEEMAAEADCEFLRHYGLKFSVEEFLAFGCGLVREEFIRKLDDLHRDLHGRGLPADFGDRLQAHYRHTVYPKIRAIDGVADLLDMLKKEGVPFCVASNSDLPSLVQKLELTGLKPYFEGRIYSKDMVANPKPAPDLFLFAAEDMGYKPDECLVVEDSVTGANAIRAANMTGIGFAGGSHRPVNYARMLLSQGVAETVQTMAEMIPAMKKRLGLVPTPQMPRPGGPQAPSPF
jgi:HAD superfamily hydrolase (TIGR01509 family)